MMKKILIGCSIVFIITIFSMVIINNIKKQNTIINKTVTDSQKTEIVTCNSNYKNVVLKIKIDSSKLSDNLNMTILSPDDGVIDTVDIAKNDVINYEKKLSGIRGDFKVQFNKTDNSSSYNYTIDFSASN